MNDEQQIAEFLHTVDTLIEQWATYLRSIEERLENLQRALDAHTAYMNGWTLGHEHRHEEVSGRKQPS